MGSARWPTLRVSLARDASVQDRESQPACKAGRQMSTKATDPVDNYVGSRVRMRRVMLGMSQEKLGEALGLTFQQIQKYEKVTNRVGASRIQQISEILQVPVSFLFEGGPTGATAGEGFGDAGS